LRQLLRTALVLLASACFAAPAAEAQPAREIAGVAIHPWRMETPDLRERTFAGLAAAGVHWARVDLKWNAIERDGPRLAAGNADWRTMDAIVEAADRHRVNLLPVVAYTPAWASAAGASWAFPASEPFERFFGAALRRYPQVPAWEIWNEPNHGVFAKPRPDPAGFVALLRSARRARDDAGSSAKLIAGGVAPGGEIGVMPWLDAVARQGGLGLVDGLGVHPYSPAEPDDPGSWMMRLQDLHERLAGLGRADLPLWLTEYGAPSTPVANGYAPALTEDQQAERLRVAFTLAARLPWVENLTWFEYRDGCRDMAQPECNFGLVHDDLSPKPSFEALREVVGGTSARLRPRLALRSRSVRRRRERAQRVTVRGRLVLPGSPRPTARILVRLLWRNTHATKLRVAVRRGVFSIRLTARGAPPGTIEARYAGSRTYEPVRARVRVVGSGRGPAGRHPSRR
jgi:polysaccharide biosynthesis protein PslG